MKEKSTKNQIERAPVVVIMGHIDHGKSTLLDYIRKSNVTEGEAGGITQHISAYEVTHKTKENKERKITFLDTPGHEAFSQMRSRGANVADMAILIVSAEDNVKTQTLESLDLIKEAKIPLIVAINKIDKTGADIERTKASLLENKIYLEGLGGDIPWVAISAKEGTGVDELLDLLLLVADLEELTGDLIKNACGVVIESNVDTKKGISATLIIKNGTLKSGMFIVIGNCIAPVRIMEDFLGNLIKEARFSSPIRVIGFSDIPNIGAKFESFKNKKDAKKKAEENLEIKNQLKIKSNTKEPEDDQTIIPIIIKADFLGTIDAIEHEINKIDTEHVKVKIVQKGAGNISENDVRTAGGKKHTIIVGFNVSVDSSALDIAEHSDIEIRTFNIIYELAEWLNSAIKKRTPKIIVEEISGKFKVLKTFSKTKDKQVIGGRVEDGTISIGEQFKISRKNTEIGHGKITTLQIQKIDTKKVEGDNEFGSQVQSKIEIAPGDIIESFKLVEK